MPKNRILPILLLLFLFGCKQDKPITIINTTHLDHLYEEFTIDSDTAAFIWIYADYPDYHVTEAAGEGIACVDDAARAAVFYLRYHHFSGKTASLQQAKRLLRFLLYLQADNGLFYNFIDEEKRIVKDSFNSKPEPNWWTWRAMWAIGEAMVDTTLPVDLRNKLKTAYLKTLPAVYSLMESYPQTTNFQGMELPTWLPQKYAADQAAVLTYALLPYYKMSSDEKIRKVLLRLAEGMILMQSDAKNDFSRGAFLSWKNIWHAYGNAQSDALLSIARVLYHKEIQSNALREVKDFYPFLIKKQYLNRFEVCKENDQWQVSKKIPYEQIAYGIRPIVFASIRAYHLTGDSLFLQQAIDAAAWFFGENSTGKRIYNPETGVCFDGIDSPEDINYNSGAESTIEALLTLLEIQRNQYTELLLSKIRMDETQ